MLVVNKMLAVFLTAAFITSSAAEFGDKIISDDVTYTTAANTDIPVQNGNNAQLTSFKDISTGFNFKSHDDTTSPESTTSLNTHLRHVNRNHGADDKQISATEAWLPNVLLTTAHPPLAGRYNLYRSDVTPSPHLTDNFRDRRPSDSYQKKSPKTSTSGSDYHKSYRQPEKKPAPVFATFDKFLKTHGIKETGYFNPTIKKEMLPKQSSSAISFQHSYMNSNRSPSPSDFDSIASSSFDRFPTSNIRKQSIREKKHSTDYLSPATTVQSFYFRPPTESELARTQAPNKLYHNDLKVAYSDSHNFVQASEESKKDKQNTLFTNEISSNANSLQNNKIHTAVPLSFSNFNVGSSGHKQYVTSPPTYRQKHVKYPETMRPDISNKNIRSEMAGQSGLKETIIKSPANNQNGDPKTNIATSTHFKAVLLQEDDKRYENQKKSFTPPQPQFHNAGQQFRYPRPMLKMPFITQHNIILTPKPYMQKLLSIPPVYDRMNAIRNPMKITTTGLGGRNIRRPFTREPGSRNSLRLTNTNRKRTVPRTRRNNRKRHVQNGIIRADESRVRNIVAVPPKDNFFRAGQFEIPRDVIFYNDIPNDRKRTNQIFGAQHSATHRNNYFVPKPNSNFIHGRNRPQIVLNSRPPIESLSGSLRNLYVVPSSRTGRRNNVFNSPPPISDYPPDNQLPSTSFQNVVFESQKAPKYDSSNTLPKTRPAKSYSLNRGKFAYPEQNSIHNSRIHSNTYSDDDEKLRGLSQPLPHRALLETSRNKMAESHMSLLKNLQFGINGEPLDVWIPMKSDKAYDKAVAGSEQHLSVSEDRPHEGAPQHLITIPVFDVMADSLDRDYDEYIDRMDEPQALSSTEEDYTVPEYDDDYIELIYHEHEDDEEVPDHEAHEESEHELLPSYDTQEHR